MLLYLMHMLDYALLIKRTHSELFSIVILTSCCNMTNASATVPKFAYEVGQIYSLTMSPHDTCQYFGKERLDLFRRRFFKLFSSAWCDHVLYTEISEPHGLLLHKNQGARLHVHGFIRFNNTTQILNFLLIYLRKLCQTGRIAIDVPTDITEWRVYCTKQTLIPKKYRILTNFIDPNEFYV